MKREFAARPNTLHLIILSADVDEGQALVAAAQREVAHFSLNASGIAPVAAGGGKLVEEYCR
jgi:hypothetical protein